MSCKRKYSKKDEEEEAGYGEEYIADDDDEDERLTQPDIVDDDDDDDKSDDDDSDEEDEDEEDDENKDEKDDEEDEEDILLDDEIHHKKRTKAKVKYYPSLFGQILTRYEKTALIGFRSQQIVSGSEIYVATQPNDTVFDIAERELKENKLPYYIQRKLPDGSVISVKLPNLLDIC
jgi:DNA-directed RNA polymerase subunit K/omega